MKTHLLLRSGLGRRTDRPRESRFGPRPFSPPFVREPAPSPAPDLEALQDRAERLGHHISDFRISTPSPSAGSPGLQPIQGMFARRSARLAGRDEKKSPEGEGAGSEEEEEEDVVEDEGSEYEEEGETDKKKRAREKARKRREQIERNQVAGRAVDTSTPAFKLGSTSRAVSRVGRSLLESVHSRERDQIATTTTAIETAGPGPLSLPGVPAFVTLSALRQASTVPPGITSLQTPRGTFSRPITAHREASRAPGPARLNTLQVPGLGEYDAISTRKRDLTSERGLETLESERDRSTGDAAFAKRRLREQGFLKRKRAQAPQGDLAVQELIGANSQDPDIERLKTQNIGNTIRLLENSDAPLAASTSGPPVLGRHYHQSLSSLIDKPGSPSREDEALRHSYRLARESEDLSGLRSPTPDEIQGLRGFSSSLSTTWSAPPPPLATAPASSPSAADPGGKSPERKRRRKKKKKKKGKNGPG